MEPIREKAILQTDYEKRKQCKKCGDIKPLSEFVKSKSCKDGRSHSCLDCFNEQGRDRYQKNKELIGIRHREYAKNNKEAARKRYRKYIEANREKINSRRRERRAKNIDERREKDREYYQKNKDKVLLNGKKYRFKNKEKIAEYSKKYRMENKEKIKEIKKNHYPKQNELDRLRRKSDPQWKLNRVISNYIYQTLKGKKLGRNWESLVGYTCDDLTIHLENLFKEGMAWTNYGKWHIDHKIPIAAFNFTKPEHRDFKRCWSLENLQPMWAKANLEKGSSLEKHFQPSLPI